MCYRFWRARQDYSRLHAFHPTGHQPALIKKPTLMFKIVPDNFVLRAPALRPSGRAAHVQNCSRKFCRTCSPRLSWPMLYPSEPEVQYHILFGTPGRIRTCYPRLRRPMLYPSELQAQICKTCFTFLSVQKQH